MTQPAPPAHRIACRIDTRTPATGLPLSLAADDPAAIWQAKDAASAINQLPDALQRLSATGAEGLLVGLLPYSAEPGGTPATLLVFDHFTKNATHSGPGPGPFRLTQRFAPDWGKPGYTAAVARAQEYLAAGDAYQVNLAQRFTAHYTGSPRAAFELLRERHRPPYAAWIDLGDRQVLCLSPESFLEVDHDRVTTRPIKGTRPRGVTPAEDAAQAAALVAHPKDRAENLMIVDLLRNDLGKVCVTGSVQTPELFRLASFTNVHHLVSTVTGLLRPGCTPAELLAACFPGGSITGAPKRRAMEIIAELEPHPRDAYCGTVFWMTADGTFGSNIAIRTFVARDGVMHGWAGAGIVADSSPDGEYQECLDKLAPLMGTLEAFFL